MFKNIVLFLGLLITCLAPTIEGGAIVVVKPGDGQAALWNRRLNDAVHVALDDAGASKTNYECDCTSVPDNKEGKLSCTCSPRPTALQNTVPLTGNQGNRPSGILSRKLPGSNVKPEEGLLPEKNPPANADDANCPIGCPAGWVQWGFSENCYLMPSQPAKLDTFWNQQQYCKSTQPTAYVAVINGLIEQGVGSAVALQYAANWFLTGTNSFFWIGGYTKENGEWAWLDGSDQSYNVLIIAADFMNYIKTTGSKTCIGADAKTLGLWQSRPCSDTTGAVICEMPKRRVCGAQGGMLPVSPIKLDMESLKNLFPQMPSIPYLGQLLGEDTLGASVFGSAGSAITSWWNSWWGSDKSQEKPTEVCPLACPPGWNTWGATDHCYKMPDEPAKSDNFWNQEAACKKADPSSHIMFVDGLIEQAAASGISAVHASQWIPGNTQGFIWLGAYAKDGGWTYLDGKDQGGNVLVTAANYAGGTSQKGTCLAADLQTFGAWAPRSCSDPTGVAICEMDKKPICGPKGGALDVKAVAMNEGTMKTLFPKMPKIPYLGQILGDGGLEHLFNLKQAQKNNQTNQKFGDTTTYVMCVKKGTSKITYKPDWDWLYVNGKPAEIPGSWIKFSCSTGETNPFRIQPLTYLAAWTRCKNRGYETAQPANNLFSGWYPFQVGQNVAEYYRELKGWVYNTYEITAQKPMESC